MRLVHGMAPLNPIHAMIEESEFQMISSLLSANLNRHRNSIILCWPASAPQPSTIPRVARMALTPHKNYVHKIFPISLVRKFHHNHSLLRVFNVQ